MSFCLLLHSFCMLPAKVLIALPLVLNMAFQLRLGGRETIGFVTHSC